MTTRSKIVLVLCGLSVVIVAFSVRFRVFARPDFGFTNREMAKATMLLVTKSVLQVRGVLDFSGTDVQRPVAILSTDDGTLLILDNEGALFTSRFLAGSLGPPARLALSRALDLPIDMDFVGSGRSLVVAGREGLTTVDYPDSLETVGPTRFFDTVRHVAALGRAGVIVSVFGTDGPRLLATANVGAELISKANVLLSEETIPEPPRLATCGDKTLVLQDARSARIYLFRAGLTVPVVKTVPEAVERATIVASRSANRVSPTERVRRLGAALTCGQSVAASALAVAWPALMFVNTATEESALFLSPVPLEGNHPVDIAVSESMNSVFVLYGVSGSAGRIVIFALPEGLFRHARAG